MEKEYKSSIKGVRLTQEEKSIVESIQKEQQLSDFSKAVCYILHDYLRQQEEIQNLQQKNQKLEEANQKQMTRIRLASNGADVSTQTVIEVLNTLCWQMQMKDFRSTDQMLHPVVEEAQKTVKELPITNRRRTSSKRKRCVRIGHGREDVWQRHQDWLQSRNLSDRDQRPLHPILTIWIAMRQ